MRKVLLAATLGAMLLVVLYVTRTAIAQDPKETKHAKWEYKVMTVEQLTDLVKPPKEPIAGEKALEELSSRPARGLDVLGAEGWELVGVGSGKLGGLLNDDKTPVYIFKRPK
jgi:hypothetical protein